MIGTADYMAPEQAGAPHAADARADIYSLGCTLHFLLTGRPPYPAPTPIDCLLAHRERPIPDLAVARPDLPHAVDRVFRTMLAKRPEERPGSMDEVIRQLEAVGAAPAHPPTGLAPPSAPAPGAARPSRRRVLARGGQGLAIAGSAFLGWHLRSLVDPPPEGGGAGRRAAAVEDPVADAGAYQREWARVRSGTWDQERPRHGTRAHPPGDVPHGQRPGGDRPLAVGTRDESLRESLDCEAAREMTIGRPFYLGVAEVTVGQFRRFAETVRGRFVSNAERNADGWGLAEGQWRRGAPFCWRDLGQVTLTDEHPVMNLNGVEAVAFCEWLSEAPARTIGCRRSPNGSTPAAPARRAPGAAARSRP
jgi:hypothetical protein